MDRRRKVELFEQLQREYEFGVGTIKGVAKKFGVHRQGNRVKECVTTRQISESMGGLRIGERGASWTRSAL